ncbi:MAG TPA: hypothetical protein VFJ85_14575 [Acidimicrobiales bacterium]|nr:hypothetical protein [Acidimicrobiales bacterium]
MSFGEEGQAGGIEGVVFGVLVFVLGTTLVINAWGVIDAKLATTSAAREAARTYVESTSADQGQADAEAAAREAIKAQGRDPNRGHYPAPKGAFARCSRITYKVTYDVPLIAVPVLGQTGHGITVSSEHSEVVDPYRAGLPGEAACG